MAVNNNNESNFLKYDYLSLREEMQKNLRYQKELGWTCVAAVLAFLGAVLVVDQAIPELCLLPLPILLFCSAKVKELKKSNIRIIDYIDKKAKESSEEKELWEMHLIKERSENSGDKSTWYDRLVLFLATSEYMLMGGMCLLIYVMKTMGNHGLFKHMKDLRGCGLFLIGCLVFIGIVIISKDSWKITGGDLNRNKKSQTNNNTEQIDVGIKAGKNSTRISILLDVVQVLSLAVIFFTLLEMRTERIMQYKPNLVFTPSYFVIRGYSGTFNGTDKEIEDIYERMSVFSPEVENMNIVFDNGIDDNGDLKTKYKMYSSLTNIGAGNATNIKIQISKDSIINAIEEMNNDISFRNERLPSEKQIKPLSFEDYTEGKEYTDICTDVIFYSNGEPSLNSINSSTGTIVVPYLLCNQENAYKLYFPEIYYTFITETVQRNQNDFTIYEPLKFPDIAITISYDDVHGKHYSYDYAIHTRFSHYNRNLVGTVSLEPIG